MLNVFIACDKYNTENLTMADLATQKQEIFDYVHAMLGGGMVDVELDPIHYETALTKALTKYRQRSEAAVEESYMFFTTVPDQNEYTLPNEIMEVRQIYRRGIGSRTNGGGDGGSGFEPFGQAQTNTYLLAGSKMGGLATYDMIAQHRELVGRMFGAYIAFKWSNTSKKLTIFQRPRSEETLMLYCYNYRPDADLLMDYQIIQWIKDYTLAASKYMLGEARSKFSTIAGPQGGSSLNGDTLKAEAQSEIEKLELELSMSVAGGTGYGFIIG